MLFKSFLWQRRKISLCAVLLAFIASAVASPALAASVILNWNDTSKDETGFKIERMPAGGSYSLLATVGTNVKAYTDTGVVGGSSYCYRVSAYNSRGSSAPSNSACTQGQTSGSSGGTTSGGTGGTGSGSTGTTGGSSGGADQLSVSYMTGKWKNYKMSLVMKPQNRGDTGVMFRYLDNKNFYRFVWDADNDKFRLEAWSRGVVRVLASQAGHATGGKFYPLSVTVNGSQIVVTFDGKQIFSVTDSTIAEGQVALYSSLSPNSAFDNVVVTDLQTGNVLLQDSFSPTALSGWTNTLAGWTIIDEASNGPSSWSISNGILGQKSAIGSIRGGDSLGTFALYTRGSWTNYRLTLSMASMDNDTIGVMFRFKDDLNYYRFSWNKQYASRKLEKRVRGTLRTLAEDSVPFVIGSKYQLTIMAQGTKLQVLIDGRVVFSVTDSALSGGTVALYSRQNTGANFDNITVEDLKTGSILLWDEFKDKDLKGWTILDDDENGSYGPSVWSANSGILVQSGNIGGGGTIAIY